MILYTSTTVDLYPFFIGHYPFPFYPGSLRPFLYSHPIVPSTPYPTTPVSGDRAPIRDSRPRNSRGHEACLSPPYVIHSFLSPHPSRDLHMTGLCRQAFPLTLVYELLRGGR